MLLSEAKEILKKNGYKIIEAFADDAENYNKLVKKSDRFADIRDKYVGKEEFKVVLNDYITLEVKGNTVGVYHGTHGRNNYGGSNGLFEFEFETPEELLELLPKIEKRAIKASLQYIEISDDDVEVDDAIAEIKENISKIKTQILSVIKARKRAARLYPIEDKLFNDRIAARKKAAASWEAENPINVGSPITVEMKSGKKYTGKITAQYTDRITNEEYWIITRTDNGKKIKLNKDPQKRNEKIFNGKISYFNSMKAN